MKKSVIGAVFAAAMAGMSGSVVAANVDHMKLNTPKRNLECYTAMSLYHKLNYEGQLERGRAPLVTFPSDYYDVVHAYYRAAYDVLEEKTNSVRRGISNEWMKLAPTSLQDTRLDTLLQNTADRCYALGR